MHDDRQEVGKMSRAILLTGTSELEPTPSPLAAGPLSASLDRGQLRDIRWRGVEILRALSFLVRTPGWGTPAPENSGFVVEAQGERFQRRLTARSTAMPGNRSARG